MKREDIKLTINIVALLLAIICALLLVTSCKTKYVAVPEIHYRDSVRVSTQHDTLLTFDSIFMNTYTKGDTVYAEKYKYKTLYKTLYRTDTITKTKIDSVSVAVPVIKEVKKMTTIEKILCTIGVLSLSLLTFYLVYRLKLK